MIRQTKDNCESTNTASQAEDIKSTLFLSHTGATACLQI